MDKKAICIPLGDPCEQKIYKNPPEDFNGRRFIATVIIVLYFVLYYLFVTSIYFITKSMTDLFKKNNSVGGVII